MTKTVSRAPGQARHAFQQSKAWLSGEMVCHPHLCNRAAILCSPHICCAARSLHSKMQARGTAKATTDWMAVQQGGGNPLAAASGKARPCSPPPLCHYGVPLLPRRAPKHRRGVREHQAREGDISSGCERTPGEGGRHIITMPAGAVKSGAVRSPS